MARHGNKGCREISQPQKAQQHGSPHRSTQTNRVRGTEKRTVAGAEAMSGGLELLCPGWKAVFLQDEAFWKGMVVMAPDTLGGLCNAHLDRINCTLKCILT